MPGYRWQGDLSSDKFVDGNRADASPGDSSAIADNGLRNRQR